MPILHLRIDVPGADPETTPIRQVAQPIVNAFNNEMRARKRDHQQVGLETLEGQWETDS